MSAIDLNLLRVLDVLLEERSVTRAGARLGLTQSAVSHALGRLRQALNDELFVREASGMRPTARALEMAPQVHAAITQLQAALVPPDFDPASSTRCFTITTGSYGAAVLGPALVHRLADVAPLTELTILESAPEDMDVLDARQSDFVIGGVLAAPGRFARESLFVEALAWIVNAESPLGQRNDVDLEALASVPHIVIGRRPQVRGAEARHGFFSRASWEDAGAFDAALAARGLQRRVGVTVSDIQAAMAIAARSHMPALLPRRLALLVAQRGSLKLIEPPYVSPPAEINLVYLKDRLSEPHIAWMRNLLHEVSRRV